jgi:aldehyde oxidoreductase
LSRDGEAIVDVKQISFFLNGQPTLVKADPERPLIDALRRDLGLTGTKKGCDYEGQCGTCTVIVDGRAVRSCRTPIHKVAGKRVTTIEGIGSPGNLHPLQQAFIDSGAVQCGFCTPGMIMAGKALLDQNGNPDATELSRALTGNLCRCTGYAKILQAVQRAAALMRGDTVDDQRRYREAIGGDPRRPDAIEKVTGRTRFAADLRMPGMLHAKVLRSPHTHARIRAIDAERARALPGVEAVLTSADIPGVLAFSDKWSARAQDTDHGDQGALEPVLAIDRVRMRGEPVAIVVAVDEATAMAALEQVDVVYEPLEPLLDPGRALQDSAPALHPDGNLYEYGEIKRGDVKAAPEEARVQVESRFSIPGRDHGALEPESALAYVDDAGRVVVIGPTHQPHMRRQQIAEMLAIPPDRVRVVAAPQGGSFGSRHHFWLVVAAALPAFLLGRPVRIVYSRREVFDGTFKDYPFDLEYRVTATQDGRLRALQARALGDAGPYGGAPTVAPFVALSGSGPYVWEAIDFEVRVAHTNGANAGPLRGYGMPHGVVGLECTLDELAYALKVDPWTLRMKNAADESTGACTGQPFDEPFGFKEVLRAIKPDWKLALERQSNWRGDEKYGVGIAAGWYQFGKAGKLQVPAEAELTEDGEILLYYCAMNSGQGFDTTMGQLVAEELNIPRGMVAVVNSDTDFTLDSGIYGAAKTTYWVGGAVVEAARQLKGALLTAASDMLGVDRSRLETVPGGVQVRDDTRTTARYRDLVVELRRRALPLKYTGVFDLEGKQGGDRPYPYLGHFSVGVALAEVIVDTTKGKTRVARLIVAQDVGRAINPIDVEGQIEGAMVMELGAALMEEYVPGQTVDLVHYRIPRVRDVPELKTIVVEVASKDGPFGAKGVGEAASGHVRAAILNAIRNGTGVRVTRLPASAERIRAALSHQAGPTSRAVIGGAS